MNAVDKAGASFFLFLSIRYSSMIFPVENAPYAVVDIYANLRNTAVVNPQRIWNRYNKKLFFST